MVDRWSLVEDCGSCLSGPAQKSFVGYRYDVGAVSRALLDLVDLMWRDNDVFLKI